MSIGETYAFHGGAFVPAHEIRLAPTLQALNYGTGVFEGIRAYWSRDEQQAFVFRLPDHLRRLQRSARTLRIDLGIEAAELAEAVVALLRHNDCRADTYIRPLAYKQALEPGTPFGVRLTGVSSQLTISTVAMGSYVPADGLRCAISSFRRVPSVSIPSDAKITGTYVNNALAVQDAQSQGYDDALMLDVDGFLTEASTSNVFLRLAGGEVVTPPVTSDILPGITRATVLRLVRDHTPAPVIERPVLARELRSAEEVFVTGTGVEITPVIEIDGRPVGTGAPGPLTLELQAIYGQVVRGAVPHYRHWLTPVLSA